MPTDEELITHAYDAFNARDIDTVLSVIHPDVLWANGMEGGHVEGHAALREYWTHQWQQIDPYVQPVEVRRDDEHHIRVTVHQVVCDKIGAVLVDQYVQHVYQIERSFIRRMDIVTPQMDS